MRALSAEICIDDGTVVPITGSSPHYIPRRFRATITDLTNLSVPLCELTIVRDDDPPRPVLDELRILRSPDGTPPNATNTRLPIERYMKLAIEKAAEPYSDRDRELPVDDWPRTRGKQITRERLERVASIYRQAVREGEPPLSELARRLSVAHSTAGRYVVQAREAKLLGPALGRGVAGERS